MKVAEFVAEILLKGGGQAIQDVRKISAGIKDLRLGLGAALKDFYQISAAAREMAVSLDMYQLNTGLSSEQLQKLSFQASQAGVSMMELGGAIQKLQQMNANARLGYGWDPVLSRFGLRPGQDPVSQLNQIGNALRRLQATNPAEAHALAMKAGLSDSMYYALLRGTTEQMEKQFILTQKEQSALVKLNQQWNKFWFYLKQITVKMQVLSAGLQTRFLKIIINAAKGFFEIVRRAHELIDAHKGLKMAVIALGLAITAYFAPWLLVLGAVALALEDIWVYFNGGDSITGRIIDWVKGSEKLQRIWVGLKYIFESIKEVFEPIVLYFSLMRDVMQEISEFIDKHPNLAKIMDKVSDAALQTFSNFANPYGALEAVGGLVQNINITNHFEDTGDPAKNGEIAGKTGNAELKAAQGQIPARSRGGK